MYINNKMTLYILTSPRQGHFATRGIFKSREQAADYLSSKYSASCAVSFTEKDRSKFINDGIFIADEDSDDSDDEYIEPDFYVLTEHAVLQSDIDECTAFVQQNTPNDVDCESSEYIRMCRITSLNPVEYFLSGNQNTIDEFISQKKDQFNHFKCKIICINKSYFF